MKKKRDESESLLREKDHEKDKMTKENSSLSSLASSILEKVSFSNRIVASGRNIDFVFFKKEGFTIGVKIFKYNSLCLFV